MPKIRFAPVAAAHLKDLEERPDLAKRLKAVRSALGKLEVNPRHPGLKTHEYKGEKCPHGDKVFEAYAENQTPAAYRLFWCYEPAERDVILILAITPHP